MNITQNALKQLIEQELQLILQETTNFTSKTPVAGKFEPINKTPLVDITDRTYSADDVRLMGYNLEGITDSPFVQVKTKNADGTEGVAYQLSKRSRDLRDYDLLIRDAELASAARRRTKTPLSSTPSPRRGIDVPDPMGAPSIVGGNIESPVEEIPVGTDPFKAIGVGNQQESLQITLDTLRKLINEEFQRKGIQEKQDERSGIPDVDDDQKLSVAKALDTLEKAAEAASDRDETLWYIAKVGSTFGLEPQDED
jgi:hypothetical protein